METIQELNERLDGLISSISSDDLANKEFIAHKYMNISLHAHTERCALETGIKNNVEKMKHNKNYNLYKSIEAILSKKAHESTAEEMYQKILECKTMVANSAS